MEKTGSVLCDPRCLPAQVDGRAGYFSYKGQSRARERVWWEPGMLNSYLFLQLYRKFQLLAACPGKPHLVTLSEQTEKKEGEPSKIPLWIQPPVHLEPTVSKMWCLSTCFAYGLEISASPSNWGIFVGLSDGMANAGRTVKHIERLDAFPSQHGKELSWSTLPHLDSALHRWSQMEIALRGAMETNLRFRKPDIQGKTE